MRLHRIGDPLHVGRAEPDPQPATDDYRFDVEQVDGRSDPRAERPDGTLQELDRELVLVLERARPNSARQASAVVFLHQLEEVGLAALLFVEPAHVGLPRPTAGVRLPAHAPPPGAPSAVDLPHDVPDLPGAAAPGPGLAVENQASADTGPPEDAEQRAVGPRGPEPELGVGGDLNVVGDRDLAAEPFFESSRQGEAGL